MTSLEIANAGVKSGPEMEVNAEIVERILHGVERDSWKSAIESRDIEKAVEEHVDRISSIMPNFNYEAFCVNKLIENTSRMSAEKALQYMGFVESIAYFYSKNFGEDVASLVITGLLVRNKSIGSISAHYYRIANEINSKSLALNALLQKNSKMLSSIYNMLSKENASIFRIFRRGKIMLLNKEGKRISRKLKRIEAKIRSNSEMLEAMERMLNKRAGKDAKNRAAQK
ncbi:MAG: hypothetical protein QXW57_04465 [Candidatus Micrarchaeaceae archaeon]